ncbi:MAG: hypothetical protein RLY89_797 [Bacteroidota bacterium]|jgi:hypothetical protein
MKQLASLLAILVLFSSCRMFGYKHIEGNGNIITQSRNISKATKVKLAGSFDVELTPGAMTKVEVVGDDNILPFIYTEEKDGFLVVKSKDYLTYNSTEGIKIKITTPQLENLQLAGSGNIIGQGKFTGSDKLVLKIAGSGDIKLEINTPKIESDIAGSGSISLTGETKDETIKIAGSGDYLTEGLMAENATVRIAGQGDVKVFTSTTLDIHIAGSGTVYYKGNPTIKQKVAGSGDIKKLD